MKKITLQEIADTCGVSRVTVWKALNKETGVSETLRNKIINTALDMGYPLDTKSQSGSSSAPSAPSYHIALVVSRPDTSMFWGKIITSISDFFKQNDCHLTFTCLPAHFDDGFTLPKEFYDGSIQGMIVMNIYESGLFQLLNDLPIPKIFLDCIAGIPFSSINGDLFLIEGRSTEEKIVQHVINQGYRRIGFIGDIHYAQTNYERYLGYCSAMQKNGLEIPRQFCLTSSFGLDSAQFKINKFLESLNTLPDMFVCTSDYIAHLVLQQLTLMGCCVPRDILISGFDNNFEFGHTSTLTTVNVQNTNMGIRLGSQLLYRLRYPNSDNAFTYICSDVVFRASTGSIPIRHSF